MGVLWLSSLLLVQQVAVGTCSAEVAYDDQAILYEGRWATGKDFKYADWPCSGVRFGAAVGVGGGSAVVRWYGLRTRLNVTIIDASDQLVSQTVLSGPATGILKHTTDVELKFPTQGNYTVSLHKMTTAQPFGPGVGGFFLRESVFEFHGVVRTVGQVTLVAPSRKPHRIEFIGASDTAGYCVDGTPRTSGISDKLEGWKFENCDRGYTGELGRRLDAEISVQGIAGIGLTQNANAKSQWQLGPLTMPDYFNRTIQTDKKSAQPSFSAPYPNAVLISLGGNDFNHQDGKVPSNSSFSEAYENFLLKVITAYGGSDKGPKLVAICGMGDPHEAALDPDNNRCRPCPHVEEAIKVFNAKSGTPQVSYIFIPCDGTVVTGVDDIGCDGHKNSKGQAAVAAFLEPKLKALMGWNSSVTFVV